MKYKNELKIPLWMIIKRGHYFYYFYYWIYSWWMDRKLNIISLAASATVFNKNENAYPVQCISYPYIKELEKYLELTSEDVFVDVGCAWGRLLAYLRSSYSIKRYVGVEINEDVAKATQKVFDSDEKVEIICGSIVNNIPDDATVFYLFNPFSSEVLREFLETLRMREGVNKFDREIKILYLYPMHKEVFVEYPEWELKDTVILRPRFMGEISMKCYYLRKQIC